MIRPIQKNTSYKHLTVSVSVVPGKGIMLCICCRKQMLSILLTKAALLLDLVEEEKWALFLPSFYILVHVACFQTYFFKSQFLPLSFFPSAAPPAFAGLTNTFISSHKNCTNIELTAIMLHQRKALMPQPISSIYRHLLLMSLWYPWPWGLIQLLLAQA